LANAGSSSSELELEERELELAVEPMKEAELDDEHEDVRLHWETDM
jgi:hypothetical protein